MAPSKDSLRIFAVFVLPALTVAAAIAQCPLTNSVCKCNEFKAPFYSVRCVSPGNNTVIANISDSIAVLELSLLNRSHVPLQFLQNSLVHTLIVGNSSLQSFQQTESKTGLPNLHHLSLENVTFARSPEWEEFNSLQNLRTLFLHNSTIKPVLGFNFSHYFSKSLESITISKCNITDVEESSFKELKYLKNLRISHNDLKTFSKDSLYRPSKMEQLRLDYNKIHRLPSGFFEEMPDLKIVSLSNNTFSTLPEEVFAPLWRSNMHLELRGNPIKCDCRMLWIATSSTKPQDIVGHCAHPKKLFGRSIKDITETDLNCT